MWVGFGGARAWCVHDAEFGAAEEVSRTAEAVEHAGAHDAGAVGVGVDVAVMGFSVFVEGVLGNPGRWAWLTLLQECSFQSRLAFG